MEVREKGRGVGVDWYVQRFLLGDEKRNS